MPDEQAFEIVSVRLCRSNKYPQTLRLHENCESAEALLDSQDLGPCVFSFQASVLKENVVVSSGCLNQVPQTGWLTRQKFTFSGHWRLEV